MKIVISNVVLAYLILLIVKFVSIVKEKMLLIVLVLMDILNKE